MAYYCQITYLDIIDCVHTVTTEYKLFVQSLLIIIGCVQSPLTFWAVPNKYCIVYLPQSLLDRVGCVQYKWKQLNLHSQNKKVGCEQSPLNAFGFVQSLLNTVDCLQVLLIRVDCLKSLLNTFDCLQLFLTRMAV